MCIRIETLFEYKMQCKRCKYYNVPGDGGEKEIERESAIHHTKFYYKTHDVDDDDDDNDDDELEMEGNEKWIVKYFEWKVHLKCIVKFI